MSQYEEQKAVFSPNSDSYYGLLHVVREVLGATVASLGMCHRWTFGYFGTKNTDNERENEVRFWCVVDAPWNYTCWDLYWCHLKASLLFFSKNCTRWKGLVSANGSLNVEFQNMDHGSSLVPVTTKKQNLHLSSRPTAISKQDMPYSFFHCNLTGKCWICSFVSETCDAFWKLNELNGLAACLKFCSGISTFKTLVDAYKLQTGWPLTYGVSFSIYAFFCLANHQIRLRPFGQKSKRRQIPSIFGKKWAQSQASTAAEHISA